MLKSMCIYDVFYPCAYLNRHNFRYYGTAKSKLNICNIMV